jgi:hypothetical protein
MGGMVAVQHYLLALLRSVQMVELQDSVVVRGSEPLQLPQHVLIIVSLLLMVLKFTIRMDLVAVAEIVVLIQVLAHIAQRERTERLVQMLA